MPPRNLGSVASRGLSTSSRKDAPLDGLGARLRTWRQSAARLAFGRRYEQARIKGGVTPQEDRENRDRARREAALGAIDSSGEALLDDATSATPVVERQEEQRRIATKALKRRLRKRWGAPQLVHQRIVAEVDDLSGSGRRVKRVIESTSGVGGEAASTVGLTEELQGLHRSLPAPREVVKEHKYSTATFRISVRKLSMLAHQIGHGKPIDFAILQMEFSAKRAARRIRSTLCLARDHAVAKGLRRERLVVAEAWVGKGRTYKKMVPKGRGRAEVVKSKTARMCVVLREGKSREQREDEAIRKARRRMRSIGTGGVARVQRPLVNIRHSAGWQW